MLLISATQFCNRYYGLSWNAYLIYTAVCVLVTGWVLPLSYEKAPSLFHPWFLSIGLLSICGFLGSRYLFHDSVSTHHYIGVVIILIGSAILIKP